MLVIESDGRIVLPPGQLTITVTIRIFEALFEPFVRDITIWIVALKNEIILLLVLLKSQYSIVWDCLSDLTEAL